jgi:antitoxin component of RelBE/YafQ-DinJ toxin-antitoxin module
VNRSTNPNPYFDPRELIQSERQEGKAMNLTISIDEELVARAREVARQRGTTIEDVIRVHLAEFVDAATRAKAAKELIQLLRNTPGRSGGKKIRREDAYEGRIR